MTDYDVLEEYKKMSDVILSFGDNSSEIEILDERMKMELVNASSVQMINNIKKKYCLLRYEMVNDAFRFIETSGLLENLNGLKRIVSDYRFVFEKYKLSVKVDNLPLMIAANSFYIDDVVKQSMLLSQKGKKGIL